jgi:hypothetical protein
VGLRPRHRGCETDFIIISSRGNSPAGAVNAQGCEWKGHTLALGPKQMALLGLGPSPDHGIGLPASTPDGPLLQHSHSRASCSLMRPPLFALSPSCCQHDCFARKSRSKVPHIALSDVACRTFGRLRTRLGNNWHRRLRGKLRLVLASNFPRIVLSICKNHSLSWKTGHTAPPPNLSPQKLHYGTSSPSRSSISPRSYSESTSPATALVSESDFADEQLSSRRQVLGASPGLGQTPWRPSASRLSSHPAPERADTAPPSQDISPAHLLERFASRWDSNTFHMSDFTFLRDRLTPSQGDSGHIQGKSKGASRRPQFSHHAR